MARLRADDGCDEGGETGGSRGGSRAGIVRTRFQTIGLCSTMPTVVRGGAFCEVRAGVRPLIRTPELQFELVDFVVEGQPVVGREAVFANGEAVFAVGYPLFFSHP